MSTRAQRKRNAVPTRPYVFVDPSEPIKEAQAPVEVIDLTSSDSSDDIDATPKPQNECDASSFVAGQLNYLRYHSHYWEILSSLHENSIGLYQRAMDGEVDNFDQQSEELIDQHLWRMIQDDLDKQMDMDE